MSDSRDLLSGVIPILVTPYDTRGRVDWAGLDSQLSFLRSTGVRSVGVGYGSEVGRLSQAEADRISEVSVAAGLAVIGNLTLAGLEDVQVRLEHFAEMGVAGVMLRPAPLQGVSGRKYVKVLAAHLGGSPLPLILQDAVQNTGVDLAVGNIAWLAINCPSIVAFKVEPRGAAVKMSSILSESGVRPLLIGGGGGVGYLHELQRGAGGTMPGPAFPELFLACEYLHRSGDRRRAFEILGRMLPLMNLGIRSLDSFIVMQKIVLARRGVLAEWSIRGDGEGVDAPFVSEVLELIELLDVFDLLNICRDIVK